MEMTHPLKYIVKENRNGIPVGMYSACTANEIVIEAVMERALESEDYVLIEATANQVNQYGGYTGMKPDDFVKFCNSIAEKVGFPKFKMILGGDHLGPLTWVNLSEKDAMKEAGELIKSYVKAGFTKIHLDTSMRVADDDENKILETSVIAARSAQLCKIAENTFQEMKISSDSIQIPPIYIIGSEVPIPGGTQEEDEKIHVTSVSDLKDTMDTFRKTYEKYNLSDAWKRVIGVVVQPGVEFGDASIDRYNRNKAIDLTASLCDYPDIVFEGHSTDYQPPRLLKQMVEDGIAILKVGPALTFAYREALFSLAQIEKELFYNDPDIEFSFFIEVLEERMLANPDNWTKHYHGDENALRFSRKYSYSDRSRYYLPDSEVDEAIKTLIHNLSSVEIPMTLLSQYMPIEYIKIVDGIIKNNINDLLKDRIWCCIDDYLFATRPQIHV